MYQLTRVILTTVIGFETRNERLLSFLDARTASKFFDAKKISEASTWSNLDLPEGTKLFINESLRPYYEGSLGHLQKNVEQEANTFLFYC